AWTAIIVLGLITFSLFREGLGFFPQHYRNLEIYRLAGLEFVDIARDQGDAYAALTRHLQAVRQRHADSVELAALAAGFDAAGEPLREWLDRWSRHCAAVKERWSVAEENRAARALLLKAGLTEEARELEVEQIDFAREDAPLTVALAEHHAVSVALAARVRALLAAVEQLPDAQLRRELARFQLAGEKYAAALPQVEARLSAWRYDRPVAFYESLTKFMLGSKWVTQSFWQDWYGIIPLFVGSLSISLVALLVAVPLGVGAAVYVNQIATTREQRLIKPFIEFIAVVPSVVLGFFGVAVLGEALRVLSGWPGLAWVPGFPFPERLNIITAGLLLALMAVPSIFTFAEDALNNVPQAYREASLALGSNRWQLIWQIMIPASLSGIISAVLLGLGRVIGETMVVLLCAGNRIQLPDFSAGLAVIFQPVHTMTGLIAQEIPEVVKGGLQYRALFMVAIVLFLIALLINYVAQIFVRKYKLAAG
ncbi:MAG: phosphate ABC transporter permease subunit PstC, partial [Verrucomicrobiales bacterium]|nr:phosphate ABC transporter permease subunit PstC [Verrucomicrobiales bacterium]